MRDDIFCHTLENGLRVLIKESHMAPVATCWMWYAVGAADDPEGQAGLTHWVEHMLFKRTAMAPTETIEQRLAHQGGIFNGSTWLDYTAYFETLPAACISTAIHIEADRMINVLFDPDEVERERCVILAELAGVEEHPDVCLDYAVTKAALPQHPYQRPVIGTRADLLAISHADLSRHYRTYYVPNNAVLVLVGDVQAELLIDEIERTFGQVRAGTLPPRRRKLDHEPRHERRVIVQRPGQASFVHIVYLGPGCKSPDFAPMVVLDALLSGAKPVGAHDGNLPATHTSRLYQTLVAPGLASNACSHYRPTSEPFLFELSATVCHRHCAEEVEEALLQMIAALQQGDITCQELMAVRNRVRLQIALSSESVTNQARMIGMWEVLDSYRRAYTLIEAIAAVGVEDVQRVACRYLTPHRRVVGHVVPAGSTAVRA